MILPKIPQRTTPGFAFSIVGRALLECIADRKFGEAEIGEVPFFFGDESPACVFCGTTPINRWDHLVPISKGGDTTLGNIVPACAKCDDSKRDLPFEEWVVGDAPNSPKTRGIPNLNDRLAKINAYVRMYAYRPCPPSERLSAGEVCRFKALQQDLGTLRQEFDAFIALYRQRTG
jgi:hypothetical protein